MNISEFADRAAEAGLRRFAERAERVWGPELRVSDPHWAGDRWRSVVTFLQHDAEAMIGWRGDRFLWVFADDDGGYRNMARLDASEAARRAVMELFSACREWHAQAEVVGRRSRRSHGRVADAADEAWADYPEAAVENARRALRWIDEHGRDSASGGTRVGLERANQLDNGEELSEDTVERMHSFFERHDGNQSIDPEHRGKPWEDAGYLSWLLWGGDAAFGWATEKLEEIEDGD